MKDDLKTNIETLTSHILAQQQTVKESSGDFSVWKTQVDSAQRHRGVVQVDLQCGAQGRAAQRVSENLHSIGLSGVTNVQEESQQKLDILSNDIMINMLKGSGRTCLLISEELDESIPVESQGKYAVVFDPLDGSSNIDCGVSVGTIFGIYRLDKQSKLSLEQQVLCAGSSMIAGGYCMYGSCSVLVMALGGQVNGYTLDPNIGEFVLTHKKMTIGSKKIYSLNEGYSHSFSPAIKGYLDSLKNPPVGHVGKFSPYSARYVGSMVADMHRTLLYGGVFLYPSAKLRMLYECFPMAMIIEAAGGKASNGTTRILDLVPESIHARSPIYLGNKEEVDAIESWFKKTSSK